MKVTDLMTREVLTCRPTDPVSRAVQIMWERDCGCVPVVDGERRVVGMLTDRDACMAAHTQGCSPGELRVDRVMSHEPRTCRATDDLEGALIALAEGQLHRLPVVDEEGRLEGVLSLADIVQTVQAQRAAARRKLAEPLLACLAAVTRPRPSGESQESAGATTA